MEPTPPFFEPQDTDRISAVLGDPTRRAMYLHVKQRHSPLTVNDIAEQFGIHRNAAKFHLDKLLAAGLLRAEFRRVNGKRGPGAGRPSKLYSASDQEVSFSVPDRHYDLLAHLLLRALTSGAGLESVGREFGRQMAASMRPHTSGSGADCVRDVLERLGFVPSVEQDADGSVWITTDNCPFGRVAMEAPNQEVCRLDRAIIQGILEEFDLKPRTVREHASKAHGHDVCIREVATAPSAASE